jgi:hypothetical protein
LTGVSTETREPRRRDDRLLAPTKWVATAVIPVLAAAFVILYFFPDRTMQLWSWMICPSMSALIMGAGYLAGAYFFTRVSRAREWHRVGVGFVATTVFSTILMATTILHWDLFNHDHVSFWAWLALYASTPALLPILWVKNRRTDPGIPSEPDTTVPRRLRRAVGIGGALQLAFAALMFGWPDVAAKAWAWPLDPATSRSISAFVAFPAVTWLCFLFDGRWSSFRITQQTATVGLALIGIGAVRAHDEFRSDTWFAVYLVGLVVALVLNIALHLAMDRRARTPALTQAAQASTTTTASPKGNEPMRRSRSLVLAGALAVGALTMSLVGQPASAVPDFVNGHFTLQFSTGPECQPEPFCLTGNVKGKVKGAFLFVPATVESTADTILATTGTATVTGDDGSTLTCNHAGAFQNAGDGPFVSLCIITGGTGEWAGATGYMRIAGTFTIENGGEGSYDGKVVV